MTWTSYFHQLQSEWQVAKLQNPPENPVKAKQVVKAFFISQGTRGNKWRLLLSSIPNSPLLSGWNRPGKKCLYISHPYLTLYLRFVCYPLRTPSPRSFSPFFFDHTQMLSSKCQLIMLTHTRIEQFQEHVFFKVLGCLCSLLKTLNTASKPIRRVSEACRFYLTCMQVLCF